MLRAIVTALAAAMATMGFAYAHSDKPKEAAEKKAPVKPQAKADAAKKSDEKEKHGSDHGKSGHERKH